MTSSEISKPRGYWEFWAEDARRTGSPLYARLAAAIAEDDVLKTLAARAQKGQPHANMILGAAHFLLLRGIDHPLKRFYATLGGRARAEEDDPFPDFRDFVLGHENEIGRLIETRVTNTNEVARSSILHPGFRAVAEACGEPLHLVEIGPSAGVNLIWDRYGVRYIRGGAAVASVNPDAALVMDCELRGERIPPHGARPQVARRLGLELNPIDLSNPDDRDWLRALVWPEWPARLQRLERAI